MRTLIVVESCFGNTRQIAEAVAEGLREAGADVEVTPAGGAPRDPSHDLVLLAAPTHNLGLPSAASRAQAGVSTAGGTNPGLREWLEHAIANPATRLVTIDTVMAGRFSGSAARAAHKLARRRGWAAERGPSFVVAGREGPPVDGETERARAWGESLAAGQRNAPTT